MFRMIGAQLGVGLSVVVDCPLARRSLFDRAEALAAQVRVPRGGLGGRL